MCLRLTLFSVKKVRKSAIVTKVCMTAPSKYWVQPVLHFFFHQGKKKYCQRKLRHFFLILKALTIFQKFCIICRWISNPMVQINKLCSWLETGTNVVGSWNDFLPHKHFCVKVRQYSNLAFRTRVWCASLSAAMQDTDFKTCLRSRIRLTTKNYWLWLCKAIIKKLACHCIFLHKVKIKY